MKFCLWQSCVYVTYISSTTNSFAVWINDYMKETTDFYLGAIDMDF